MSLDSVFVVIEHGYRDDFVQDDSSCDRSAVQSFAMSVVSGQEYEGAEALKHDKHVVCYLW